MTSFADCESIVADHSPPVAETLPFAND